MLMCQFIFEVVVVMVVVDLPVAAGWQFLAADALVKSLAIFCSCLHLEYVNFLIMFMD